MSGEGSEPGLRREIIALEQEDRILRGRSSGDGGRIDFAGHPCLDDLHRRNAARLRALVAAHGWPGRGLVGEDGAEAAWRFVQHAIDDPGLQREALGWLRSAAARGEIPAWQPAMLEDRILVLEGRAQRYGTQWDFNDTGHPAAFPVAEEAGLDERRARVGLGPLAEEMSRRRAQPGEAEVGTTDAATPIPAATDRAAWQAEFTAWARRVGWRA